MQIILNVESFGTPGSNRWGYQVSSTRGSSISTCAAITEAIKFSGHYLLRNKTNEYEFPFGMFAIADLTELKKADGLLRAELREGVRHFLQQEWYTKYELTFRDDHQVLGDISDLINRPRPQA